MGPETFSVHHRGEHSRDVNRELPEHTLRKNSFKPTGVCEAVEGDMKSLYHNVCQT